MNFKVTLRPSGRSFEVARDEAVLAAAIRQGVGLPYGCRDGACGSCKSQLVEGRVLHGAHQQKALSSAEEQAGWMLTCCATPQTDLLVEARTVPGAGEFAVRKMPCRVQSIARPAPDVAILRLQLPANTQLDYHAGQYVEFVLKDGVRRSYSMANAPHTAREGLELHVRHMPGGVFTDALFGGMKEKDILRLEGPFGSFFLRDKRLQPAATPPPEPAAPGRPLVLLASGTGFAPIKAIIEDMQAKGNARAAHLYWGARRVRDLYLHEWALAAAARIPTLTYVPVLSEAAPEDAWRGRTGFVHEAVMADLPDLSHHEVYACGAPAMVDAAQRDFISRCNLPAEDFYADSFTSEADKHG